MAGVGLAIVTLPRLGALRAPLRLSPVHAAEWSSDEFHGSCAGGSSRSRSPRRLQGSSVLAVLATLACRSQRRKATQCCASSEGDNVQVKEKQEADKDLDYMPSREDLEKQEIELLEATGALELQRREEAFQARKKWREENPSPLDAWENEMEAVRMDTQRRMLWGDLRKRSGGHKRYRGKQVAEKEAEIKFNRGFPLEDTEEQEIADQQQDRKWLDAWRAAWPQGQAIDPHDPESFGFSIVGEVTGAHGIHGDVRVRVEDFLCDQGYDADQHLMRRGFTNFSQDSKRVHLKSPHRRFPRPFRILTGKRVQRRVYALRLKGVETAEEAIALRGFKVYVLEPPPSIQEKAKQQEQLSGEDLYDAGTTAFSTRDALELVGAKCVKLTGEVSQEVLADFAAAASSQEAREALSAAGAGLQHFGNLSAVVPDYKLARRHRGRKAAHDLLDITLVDEAEGGEGEYLFEPDPNSPAGKSLNMDQFRSVDPNFERVTYVPFVPEMIARVDADHTGTTVYFTLPKSHIEKCTFKCRKRILDEKGLLVIPRGPYVKALLPPPGKSHAIRRRDGKRLPLHGTAPAAPADMKQPAGEAFPEPSPGVPRPPLWQPFRGLDRDESSFKRRVSNTLHERQKRFIPIDMREDDQGDDSEDDEE
eukprot:TRINITY_DN6953_c0_g1_i1.p1 TRINITY_DN6953_c0_g1~~TRINITY_DN6953_c0_g1_i1.p1  ORF type:complete len:655 (-),score=152.58 TRINITY_DN6953_c0_g1_i1:42-1985(-)